MKELLAPSNPYKDSVGVNLGCSACTDKRCDCCNNFLIHGGSTFSCVGTGRKYIIRKSLTCSSRNVVYLSHCLPCDLQGVGSTANFKSRLANYKSHIIKNERACSIDDYFIDCHGNDHYANRPAQQCKGLISWKNFSPG